MLGSKSSTSQLAAIDNYIITGGEGEGVCPPDAGFQALSKHCLQLSRLDLDECALLTGQQSSLISMHPDLQY